MKKPFAYITAVWKGGEFTVIDQAAVYCRKVYEAGFTPICPVLYLPAKLITPFSGRNAEKGNGLRRNHQPVQHKQRQPVQVIRHQPSTSFSP